MELHRRFSAPLREALADRGDPDPEVTTELITGTLEGAIRLIDAGHAPQEVLEATPRLPLRALTHRSERQARPRTNEHRGTDGA
jgi:hypothetical protein